MSIFLAEKFGDVAADIEAMQVRVGYPGQPYLVNIHLQGETRCIKSVPLAEICPKNSFMASSMLVTVANNRGQNLYRGTVSDMPDEYARVPI